MVQAHSLFFYGTLCHAAVLRRVIGNNGQHLTCRDAILEDHVRLHVAGEGAYALQFVPGRPTPFADKPADLGLCPSTDYPAVVSVDSAESAQLLKRSLEATERRVQGVLVQGLTDEDVAMLDEFEGDASQTPFSSQKVFRTSNEADSASRVVVTVSRRNTIDDPAPSLHFQQLPLLLRHQHPLRHPYQLQSTSGPHRCLASNLASGPLPISSVTRLTAGSDPAPTRIQSTSKSTVEET